jgi:hypothetical protein
MRLASNSPTADDGRQTKVPGSPAAMGSVSSPGSGFTVVRLQPMLGLDTVWLVATLAFAFVVGMLLQADQTDYWWTVKLGQELWATGQLPTADPLSFTSARQPYVEQQWLAQLVLAMVHQWGGLEAALLLRAVLLVGSVGLLYHVCRLRGAAAGAACAACGLALLSVVGGAAIRPQLFAIPLFVIFLAGTTIWLRHAWTLAVLPLAMVAWANLHGSFPLGLALLGAALLGTAVSTLQQRGRAQDRGRVPATASDAQSLPGPLALRRLTFLVALCGLAPLVNPYGLGLVPWLVDYLTFNTGGTGLTSLSVEWLPTSLASAHGVLYFLSVAVLVVVLLRVGPPSPADGLRLLGFALLALQAVRSTVWWALVMAPVLAWGLGSLNYDRQARTLAEPDPSSGDRPVAALASRAGIPALNAALIAAFLLLAGLSWPWLRPLGGLYPPERWPVVDPGLPSGAADFAATLPATRVYNTMDWGGYLAWRLAPRQRIFVDGRFQLYQPELYRDYFRIGQAEPGWADKLAAYGVEALLVSRQAQRELLRAAEEEGSWQAAYCDAEAAVYLPRALVDGRSVRCGPAAGGERGS